MTLAEAQAAANNLRTALLDNGVKRVSIELQQGVGGSGWGVAPFKRGLGHHIVSRPPGTPGLALVKKGRPDLGGPLCNGYGGFDLTARIITMAYANHPGAGGPWSVPGWGTVPVNNGRPYIFGWEFEGGILPYTDEMHDFMARCGAGTLDWLGTLPGNSGAAPVECWGEHSTWAPGRKIDRLGYTTAAGRSRIAAVRGTPTQEDDMYDATARKELLTPVHEMLGLLRGIQPAVARADVTLNDKTAGLLVRTAQLEGQVAGLVKAVGQLQGGKGLDAAEISAAAKAGAESFAGRLADALESTAKPA